MWNDTYYQQRQCALWGHVWVQDGISTTTTGNGILGPIHCRRCGAIKEEAF